MENPEAHDRLRRWWTETSPDVTTRAMPESAVLALEERYALTLPDDFRRYLLTSCPVDDGWDRENTI